MPTAQAIQVAPYHPAKFTGAIVDRAAVIVQAEARRVIGREHVGPIHVLDPFAGVGRVHRLHRPGKVATHGIEIEPEWAAADQRTICADALAWMADPAHHQQYDIVFTSPTYGNRFSDHHMARDGSERHSYRHDLGRDLTDGSSAGMPFGKRYWAFHARAWRLVFEVLRPGGMFLLNVSDFYRANDVVPAATWHRGAAWGAGFVQAARDRVVRTPRLRGVGTEATAARVAHERILVFRRPPEAQ